MKKLWLWWILLPILLVAVLALLVQMGKLPVNFWTLSLADKWTALKNLAGASQPGAASQPNGLTGSVAAAALAAAQALSPSGKVTADQAVEIWKLNHPNG